MKSTSKPRVQVVIADDFLGAFLDPLPRFGLKGTCLSRGSDLSGTLGKAKGRRSPLGERASLSNL